MVAGGGEGTDIASTSDTLSNDPGWHPVSTSHADKEDLGRHDDMPMIPSIDSVQHHRSSTIDYIPPDYPADQHLFEIGILKPSTQPFEHAALMEPLVTQHRLPFPSWNPQMHIPETSQRCFSDGQPEDRSVTEAGPEYETSDFTLQLNIPQVPEPVLVNLRYHRREGDGGFRLDSVAYGSGGTAGEMGSYSERSLTQSADHFTLVEETVPPPYYQD